MIRPQGLMTVRVHVPAQFEDEFCHWWDVEHIPQTLALPGFLDGRRYLVEGAKPKHLAWFDTADETAEAGDGFQRLVSGPTPWTKRMRKICADEHERMSFRLMREVGTLPGKDTPWLYIVHTDIPDHIVDEYNAWYDREHLPRLVNVPGVVRARRYVAARGNPKYLTAYELTDKNAFESPAGLQARKTPWTEKMRSLFYNTRRSTCTLAPQRHS